MIVIPTHAFPLTWPPGVQRTQSQRESDFGRIVKEVGAAQRKVPRDNGEGVREIRRVLKLAGAKTIVISSNLALRSDGLPHSDGPVRPHGDSGVAVYWTREHYRRPPGGGPLARVATLVPYCMPCDRFRRIADNLYAVSKSIDALRTCERYGAVSVEQAFAGFAALPAGDGSEVIPRQPMVDWRTILGGSWPDELEPAEVLAIAKARHRKLIGSAHPDQGGSTAAAADLNAAIEAAEQELKQR